jgi:hypothetical protein
MRDRGMRASRRSTVVFSSSLTASAVSLYIRAAASRVMTNLSKRRPAISLLPAQARMRSAHMLDVLLFIEFFCLTLLPGSENHQVLWKKGFAMAADLKIERQFS